MRHAWQHQEDNNRFFGNYNFYLAHQDLEKYYLQPAEVDAEAYSFLVMQDFTEEKAPYKRKIYPNVNTVIDDYSKTIQRFPYGQYNM